MKIYSDNEIPARDYPEKIKKTETPVSKTFAKIFNETYSKIDAKSQKTQQLSEIQSNTFSSAEKMPTIDHIENCLNTLDEYCRSLGNLRITINDICPIINKMLQESDILTRALNSLNNEDELKDILKQTLTISSIEITRFNRGDYFDDLM